MRLRLLLSSLFSILYLSAASRNITGCVIDYTTGEPLEYASVTINPGKIWTSTGIDGKFSAILPDSITNFTITASYIGYKSKNIKVDTNSTITIKLQPATHKLGEVVVTALESSGMTSSSKIDRDAMTHLQPTSFTDLLELLPGNISQTPNMGSVNAITLRETGTLSATGTKTVNADYNITSLGTLFIVDGAPMINDSNMQKIPGSGADDISNGKDMTNRGVDMRSISTDNIESVEIVRGIPSAEYGNLTSGMVNIKRIRRPTPLTARVKVDEYSKLFSAGKGIYLGHGENILNIDGGWLDSKVDPRNNLENYKRANFSSRLHLNFKLRDNLSLQWAPSFDYTGSFDNTKTDPDLSYLKVNDYKASYNSFNLGSDLQLHLNRKFVKLLSLNMSAAYQNDRLERHKQVAPQRASVAPTTMTEGEHDGQYLLGEYIADYVSEGKPLNLFGKLRLNGEQTFPKLFNSYVAGIEFTFTKNYGKGQIYDLTRPLSAAWTTRPRAYRDIPALKVLSMFAEENLRWHVGGNTVNAQAGLRTTQLVGLDKSYYLHRRIYLDPRLNLKWTFPGIKTGNNDLKFMVAGGYGFTTKMPTIDYLFPQCSYHDLIQLNYYDVNRPLEYSRISLRTYINDAANKNLRAARNHKWEVRIGAEYSGNRLSVTYFSERLNSGYRYSSVYSPYSYKKYDIAAINPENLTSKPDLSKLPYTEDRVLDGYSQVTNGSRIDKEGIEFQLNTKRWSSINTALTVTGAWFRSTYSNSQMLYQTVNDVVDGDAVSDRYVGIYDSNDGRVNEQFNTNFMFDTQIPQWGLVFSTSIQCMWWVKSTRLWQNGIPASYISADDGKIHDYDPVATADDKMLRYLIKYYNDDVYLTQKIPTAVYLNLKATKTIGDHLRIALFVNRMVDYLPDYKSNGLTMRRISNPYFGMELNVTI